MTSSCAAAWAGTSCNTGLHPCSHVAALNVWHLLGGAKDAIAHAGRLRDELNQTMCCVTRQAGTLTEHRHAHTQSFVKGTFLSKRDYDQCWRVIVPHARIHALHCLKSCNTGIIMPCCSKYMHLSPICFVMKRRKFKQRQAMYEADDGDAPPLYNKVSPALLWGSMYGTEHLDPSGLRKWKATAVSAACHGVSAHEVVSSDCLDAWN